MSVSARNLGIIWKEEEQSRHRPELCGFREHYTNPAARAGVYPEPR